MYLFFFPSLESSVLFGVIAGRCACPLHTASPTCKVLMRHFQGDEANGSWTWVASIPPCPEVHISLEVLTASQNATLLYSGPDHLGLTEPSPLGSSASREVLLLELRCGRPFLMLDLGGGPVTLALTASYSLADSTWHRLDVIWKDEVRVLLLYKSLGVI